MAGARRGRWRRRGPSGEGVPPDWRSRVCAQRDRVFFGGGGGGHNVINNLPENVRIKTPQSHGAHPWLYSKVAITSRQKEKKNYSEGLTLCNKANHFQLEEQKKKKEKKKEKNNVNMRGGRWGEEDLG